MSPVLAFAQSTERQIQTKTELVSALCRLNEDQQSRELLLKSHPELVNSQLWRDLNDLASAAYLISPEQSLNIYDVAIQVAGQLNDPKLLATTYYNSGRIFSASNQFSKAIDAYEKSREYCEQAGSQRDLIYILADLGAFHFILENYLKAQDYSERSIKLAEKLKASNAPLGAWPDDFGRARALQTLADIDLRGGDHSQALEKLQTSLALYQQLNGEGATYDFYIAGDLMALGRVHTAAGDNTRALLSLNRALELVRRLADPDMMASLLNSIGVLYLEQEDYAQARAHFDQSLKIYRSPKNRREEARVLLNLGVVQQRQANYDEALAYFKLGLQAAKETQLVDVQIAAGEGIGAVLTAKKDFPAALQSLNESLALAKDKRDRMRQTELLWRSAQVYYEMRDYVRSAELAEQSVTLARSAHSPKLTYLSTTTLGQSYAAQNKLDLATQTLMTAVEQVEAMREGVGGQEQEVQLFLENKVASYTALVDLLVKQNRPVDALLYAERAKGRVLLDVLSGGKADLSKVLTPTEKEEAQTLNRNIFEINDRIKKQEDAASSSLNSLFAQLDTARLRYLSFQDALYVAHPGLGIRSGRTTSLSSADVNDLTQEGDRAYLEYVVGKDGISLFVLSKNKSDRPDLKVYPIPVKPEDLAQRVNQFHERLAARHPDYLSLGRELYALLVEPAEQQLTGIETICIVPEGFLWNLPFQALVSKGERYLIEDHPLYYAPSLSVLREMTKARTAQEGSEASLIAFGNPVIGKDAQRNEELCPLPEAETEVRSVAKTFPPMRNKAFIGREASERTFKALAPTYSTIHLATHGVLDNRQPLYSHLLLTKTDGDPDNDGLLEAREIMNMKLNADLAVLSACETANGRISPGEGVIGTSWAFFVAGTRSMLVSQWKVNSASTSQLMMNFYHALQSRKSTEDVKKAKSLQEATLRLMSDDLYRHPFYWAGFVLVGSNN
jgi:CHAT domain-containing protein